MSDHIFCSVCGEGFTDGILYKNEDVYLCEVCKKEFKEIAVEEEIANRKCPHCGEYAIESWEKEDGTLVSKCHECPYRSESSPTKISVVRKVNIVTHSVKM